MPRRRRRPGSSAKASRPRTSAQVRDAAPVSHADAQYEQLLAENEELRQAVQIVESALQRFSEHYDLAPFAYLTVDQSGVVREINRAACAMLRIERPRALGALFPGFILAPDRRAFTRHLNDCRRDGSAVTRLRIAPRYGAALDVELTSRRGAGDRPDCYPTTILEVPDWAGEKQKLLAAARESLELGAATTDILAIVSHELRGPLGPLLAAVSALEEQVGDGAEVRNLCQLIRRNVNTEARLIEDLLDANRISRGKMALSPVPLELDGVVREAIEQAAPAIQAKGLVLEVALEAGGARVEADPVRLGQVFTNLIGNAIKFTPAGGQVVLRSWHFQDTVAVEVRDTGAGIDEAVLPRLFSLFEHAQRPPGSEGGLGLGLTISKGIVELHHGRISAASGGRGQGARFVVALPALPPKQVTNGAGKPRTRILVVEDDADTAEAMTLALSAKGYQVERAPSIAVALRADLAAIDLVVSDLRLPDGDGRSFLQQLRARGPVTAIALSGYGTYKDLDSAKAAGFAAHLIKPVPLEVLTETIERVLAEKHRA